ncbi:hypothetical protein Dda_7722 [Drechslerella dactyloides]|uniref:Delta(24)-sterol reductase n=1 Tax=Drechslerella dactyloides TaxID=74499 RepID=A0AAD6NH38_DREDA|nr:hypothetical protein Dda_7722 [Drechslerella dactyloides]
MLPVPFQSANVFAARDQASTGSGSCAATAGQGRVDSKAKPIGKTSRFASLFQQSGVTADASLKAAGEAQPISKAQEVPRYKAPRNGQGVKVPTPPVLFCDPNPKRVYMENVPYSAKKHEILAFFKGFKVESVDIPKRGDGSRRGIAYVNLASESEAKRAISQLHHTSLKGRRVRLMAAKISVNQKKTQEGNEPGTVEDQPEPASTLKENIVPVIPEPVSQPVADQRPLADNKPSLRAEVFNLACQFILRGEKTANEIFAEIKFNDEETIMIRDCYFKYKQAQQEEKERRSRLVSGSPTLFKIVVCPANLYQAILQMLDKSCSIHGLRKCMTCHQGRLLDHSPEMEMDTDDDVQDISAHQHTESWGSSLTLPGRSSPEYPQYNCSVKASTVDVEPAKNPIAYGDLDSAAALRLYGPKYFKENYPQQEPPIHNTYLPTRGRFNNDNPFHRQHAVVPTQPGVKTHCAFFLRTGHCDFAQQGCKFSHELPPGGIGELTNQTGRRSSQSTVGANFGQPRNTAGGHRSTEPVMKRQASGNAVTGHAQGAKVPINPFYPVGSEPQALTDRWVSNTRAMAPDAGLKISHIELEPGTSGGLGALFNTAIRASSSKIPETGFKASGRACTTGVRISGLDSRAINPGIKTNNSYGAVRNKLTSQFQPVLYTMEVHDHAVQKIAAAVQGFYERKIGYRIYHGSTNSTRAAAFQRDRMVDTSGLTHVLSVDTATRTAIVEPNVPMDKLVEATLPHGLVPPVVMEFPGITAGGGYSGTSAESSSFRHGFFDRNVNMVEIVLANGEIVRASRDDKTDLLHGAASSFGTLGVVTLLELQLVPAKPFVEVTYHPITRADEIVPKIDALTSDTSNDYLDGIMFSRDRGVLVSGRLVDTPTPGTKVQGFTAPTDPWFYLHAQKRVNSHAPSPPSSSPPLVDTVPITDYLFRYDRGGFWVGAYAFRYFITPFNFITRFLLDYFMHTRIMYHALHRSGHSNIYVIQDVAVPYAAAVNFLTFLDTEFAIYPLWLCPLKMKGNTSGSPQGLLAEVAAKSSPEYLLNFGVWGPAGGKGRNVQTFVEMNRRLENKVDSLGGKKWLYAQTYYTEDEFWNIYNKREYDALRDKYHAGYLPSVYDKVKTDLVAEQKRIEASWTAWLNAMFWSIWPLSGLYGVLAVLFGGDYLLAKRKTK